MQCPAYKLERNALFNMANLNIEMINMNNEEKFISIMSSNEPIIIEALGKFIYRCSKMRINIFVKRKPITKCILYVNGEIRFSLVKLDRDIHVA